MHTCVIISWRTRRAFSYSQCSRCRWSGCRLATDPCVVFPGSPCSAPRLKLTAVEFLASQWGTEFAKRAGVGFVQNPQHLRHAETPAGPLLQLGRQCHLTVGDIAGWFGHLLSIAQPRKHVPWRRHRGCPSKKNALAMHPH